MNLTIGRYYKKNSIIHKIDSRLKIFQTFMIINMVIFFKNLFSYFIILFYILMLIKLSQIPIRKVLKSLSSILFFMVVAFLLNLFSTNGKCIFRWKFLKITSEGLYTATKSALGLIIIMLISSILTLSTLPLEISNGIKSFMFPFGKIGLPIEEMCMIISISLNFIPIIFSEIEKIKKSQKSRGMEFNSKNLIKKLRAISSIIVPLFTNSLSRADELAFSMETRCYSNTPLKIKERKLVFEKRDVNFIVFFLIFFISVLLMDLKF